MFAAAYYVFLWILAYSIVFAGSAAAYLDPGTGSLLMQMLLGAAFTALATIKFWFAKLKSLFGKKRKG